MDRPDIYPLEIVRSFDQQNGWKDGLKGVAYNSRLALGQYENVVSGFAWSQTATPSLLMNVAEGLILSYQPTDAQAWGNLAADSQMILQQGYYAGGQVAFTTGGMSAGQSQWALLQIGYSQTDVIRAGDPTSGVLPYVNVDDLTQPFEGPGNSGVPQPTERLSAAVVDVVYGVAASSSPVPPSAQPGFVPLALVLLTFGQTAITTTALQLAGPGVYSGYPNAPYFPGVTGTIPNAPGGSHHGGIAGQAAKIDAQTELQGPVPLAILPVSNGSPTGIGGIVTVAPDIPILYQVNANPNGVLAGNQNDLAYDTVTNQLFICTVSGSNSSAVWVAINGGGLSSYQNAAFTVTPGNFVYLADTAGGGWSQPLPTAASMGGSGVEFRNIGTNAISIVPVVGESVVGQGGQTFTSVSPMVIQPGDGSRLASLGGFGWYEVS